MPAAAALIIAATVGVAGLLQLVDPAACGAARSIARPLRISFDAEMRGFLGKADSGHDRQRRRRNC